MRRLNLFGFDPLSEMLQDDGVRDRGLMWWRCGQTIARANRSANLTLNDPPEGIPNRQNFCRRFRACGFNLRHFFSILFSVVVSTGALASNLAGSACDSQQMLQFVRDAAEKSSPFAAGSGNLKEAKEIAERILDLIEYSGIVESCVFSYKHIYSSGQTSINANISIKYTVSISSFEEITEVCVDRIHINPFTTVKDVCVRGIGGQDE